VNTNKSHVGTTVLLAFVAGLLLWNVAAPGPRAVVLAAAAPAAAPDTPVTPDSAGGSISVSGSSAIRVAPDRAVVMLGVETFGETPSGAQRANERLSKDVLAAVRKLDIAERDIATAQFTLQPDYEDDYFRRRVVGYWARNTIAVTLRDVSQLEDLLVDTLAAGATAVDGVEFAVTNLRALRDQARELAVKAALEKASAMAAAAGAQLGAVTSIQEHGGWYGYYGPWSGYGRSASNYQNVVQETGSETLTLDDGALALGMIVVTAEVGLSAQLVTPQ
jgi:uncharacterized protein